MFIRYLLIHPYSVFSIFDTKQGYLVATLPGPCRGNFPLAPFVVTLMVRDTLVYTKVSPKKHHLWHDHGPQNLANLNLLENDSADRSSNPHRTGSTYHHPAISNCSLKPFLTLFINPGYLALEKNPQKKQRHL